MSLMVVRSMGGRIRDRRRVAPVRAQTRTRRHDDRAEFESARAPSIGSHTLKVHSPAIPLFLRRPALEQVRLSGHEGVNGLFEYELLLKIPDALNRGASKAADWDLDSFILDLSGAHRQGRFQLSTLFP